MSYLATIGPFATLGDLARELGITYAGYYQRMKSNPTLTRPETWRAGGAEMMTTDNAVLWIEKHRAEWAALQAAKKEAA